MERAEEAEESGVRDDSQPVLADEGSAGEGGWERWEAEEVVAVWQGRRRLGPLDDYIGGAATEGMEILLSLALAAGKIVADREGAGDGNFAGARVDYYIRCSMKCAFTNVSSF
jgi:hypothetical protein